MTIRAGMRTTESVTRASIVPLALTQRIAVAALVGPLERATERNPTIGRVDVQLVADP